jgi:MFS family permease
MKDAPDHQQGSEPRRVIGVWRHRDFAIFMGGLTPAAISSWMHRVGVGWLAWELTESTVWLGAVAAADLAPILLLSPLAGALSDRMSALTLVRITQWLQFAQAAALAACMAAGVLSIELLFALTLALGVIHAYSSAGRHALVPLTVPREMVATAISLDSAFFQASRFIGPAIAALVIPVWGVFGAFSAHAAGTFFFALAMHAMAQPQRAAAHRGARNMLQDVAEAVGYVRGHAGVFPLMIMLAAASLAVRPLQDMLPGFADDVYGAGASGLAWLTSAMGAGAMASATWVAIHGRTGGLTNMCFLGGALTSLSMIGFVGSDHFPLGLAFAAVSAYGLNTLSTSVQALVQSRVEDRLRGRVMSLYTLIYRGLPAAGALGFGALAEWIGLRWTFALAGAACLLACALLLPYRKTMIAALETRRARETEA